jgi:hypothetical protein
LLLIADLTSCREAKLLFAREDFISESFVEINPEGPTKTTGAEAAKEKSRKDTI